MTQQQTPIVHSSPGLLTRAALALIGGVLLLTWCVLGLWTALALFFALPFPWPVTAVPALLVAALFAAALRERRPSASGQRIPLRRRRLSLAASIIAALVWPWYFWFMTLDPNQPWAADHARMPRVRFEKDLVHVTDVRDFEWRSTTDFTPQFVERHYDLDKISSMYYVVVPLGAFDGIAHVFVCFGFSDGQSVAVSVESRRIAGRPYRAIASMFRQYQLIYVTGEERDILGVRGAIWKSPVRMYPAKTTPERMRFLFTDMMYRAEDLSANPEWYHLLANNCMNNVTAHLRRLGGRPLPSEIALLMTGFSDRFAYQLGYFDTDLPFDQAREVFRVDGWMQTTERDETFGVRLRETLKRREAEMKATGRIAP